MKRDLSSIDEWALSHAAVGVPPSISRSDVDGWAWQFPNGLRVIASWGGRWDHVSVSRVDRVPTWDEMCWVKETFFKDDECVIQYHPPASAYVNNHPNCLHLWRPQKSVIPMPPRDFV